MQNIARLRASRACRIQSRAPRFAVPLAAGVLACSLFAAVPGLAQNAAVVNGKAIPSAKVDEFVDALAAQGRPDSPQMRELVREELIAREIFSQEADKRGLAKTPEVQRQLDTTRQDILIRALIRDYLVKNPVKDSDVQAEYDKLKQETTAGGKEYKARHILLEKEDEAKKVIEQLNKGESFESLATQSKDPGSGAEGGDLG